LAGLYILTFSFVVVVDECQKSLSPEECNDYKKLQRVQKMAPIFISYGFLFIALMFWYFLYYWWDAKKKQKADVKRMFKFEFNDKNW